MKVNISAHIEKGLARKLDEVSKFEGRSKSYYIKKGLNAVLDEKFQDLQDLFSAQKTLKAAKAKKSFVSFDEVFKSVK